MAAMQPYGKIPLQKIMLKERADELDDIARLGSNHATAFQEALPCLMTMATSGLQDTMLVNPAVCSCFDMLHNLGIISQMYKYLPFLHETLQPVREALRGFVSDWLKQSSATFVKFLSHLLTPEPQIDVVLQTDVLGSLEG